MRTTFGHYYYLHSTLKLNDIMVKVSQKRERRKDADCLIEYMIDFYKHELVEILSKKGAILIQDVHTSCFILNKWVFCYAENSVITTIFFLVAHRPCSLMEVRHLDSLYTVRHSRWRIAVALEDADLQGNRQ